MGPEFLLSFISNKYGGSFGGFFMVLVMSFCLISIYQIRRPYTILGFGKLFQAIIGIPMDAIIVFVVGLFVAMAMTIQFILTFIPPFGPIIFNTMNAMSGIHDIKNVLGIIYGFFIIVFAKQYLNNTILSGMTLVIIGYALVNLNNLRRLIMKKIYSSEK
jgi:hypothetical protein